MTYALIVLLAVALAGVAYSSQKRHKRLRRRVARARRREMELLHAIKPLYVERAVRRLERDGRTARMPIEFRSEYGEDLFLDELFADRAGGFFIEVGAFDGYTFAVTYALECQGWTGLLVEPAPSLHAQAEARRPGSRVVNAALSRRGSTGTASFTHFLPSDDNEYEASSFLSADAPAAFDKRPPSDRAETIQIPLTTMDDLLADHQGPIDLCVIDVEGGELALLDGFDLERRRPRVILIEDYRLGAESPITRHLTPLGYQHVAWLAYNRVMIRSDEPELIERARRIAQHTATPDTRG